MTRVKKVVSTLLICILVMVSTLCVMIASVSADVGTNVALNKSSSSDSEQIANGNTASKANDGDTTTRWCADDANINHWWKVDLGQNYNINGTEVMWEKSGIVYKYKVDTSNDNVNWSTMIDKTNNTLTQQVQTDNFTVSARYVRITVTGLIAGAWASIYEFKVFSAAVFDANAYYKIVNRNSGKALDVSGASMADGAKVIQWSYSQADNQLWQIIDVGGGYYKLTNKNSSKALDVSGQSTADGAQLIQWTYNGGNNQQWQIDDIGTGYYKITSRNSGKCVDVNAGATSEGAQIIQWTYGGGNNQQWQIVKEPIIHPADTNIKYFGRWDKSVSNQFNSYYGGAYFKVKFTGTSVKLILNGPAKLFAKIDNGQDIAFNDVSGVVNLTPTALSAGTHSLSVAARSQFDVLQFEGLILDANATTVQPAVSSNIIEFIGDSITEGWTDPKESLSDYAWKAGEALGAEHTQIAYAGICLSTPPASSNWSQLIPMSTNYFKMKPLHDYPDSPDWNFAQYTPKCVVINLGTNDNGAGVADSDFQSTYVTFLTNIRAKFPNAEILVLRTFGTPNSPQGFKVNPTQAAVNARIAAGDNKVHYVDTNGWVTQEVDFTDGLHPSESGHDKIAAALAPILQQYLK